MNIRAGIKWLMALTVSVFVIMLATEAFPKDLNVCEAIEIFNQGFARMDQELINQVTPMTLKDIEVSKEELRVFFQETFGISDILDMKYGLYVPLGDKCKEPTIPFYHEVTIRYEKQFYVCTSVLRGYFMATWAGEGLQVRFIERLPSVIVCDLTT